MNICYKCIGDTALSAEMRSEGNRAVCEFCSRRRKSITLNDLACRVREVIDEHYQHHQDEWGADDGQPVVYLIADLLNCEKEVAEAVRDKISDDTAWEAHEGGYSDPFGSEACYIEKAADIYDFQETWEFFIREIRTRARYFSKEGQSALEQIFGDLTELKTWSGEPVIKMISSGTDEAFLYRGRIAFSEAELEEMLRSPVRELGPPPSRFARPGRMNAKGISMFYGAQEKDTCIAEVRAPVGSHVVIGRFEIIRELRLLDLDKLNSIYAQISVFDARYRTVVGRIRFFRRLVEEISKPIMPRDEEDEYLITQTVAEFLATNVTPTLDGILFSSAQMGGDGRNAVLFHHASGVEPYSLPTGTKITANMGWITDEDADDSIAIWETTPRPPLVVAKKKERKKRPSVFDFGSSIIDRETYSEIEDLVPPNPRLRLLVSDIEVVRIRGVRYDAIQRRVNRYRSAEGDDEILGIPDTFTYFAYGSNMSTDRLRYRISRCRAKGIASLVGHELRFHKASKDGSAKCDAFETSDLASVVVGVLFDVPLSDKTVLDKAEGLGSGYDDAKVTVIDADGLPVEAITYVASPKSITTGLKPYDWYKDFVVQGAVEHDLPEAYVNRYIRSVAAIADPDQDRTQKRVAEVAKEPKFRSDL
ncbi:RES domain-containing protein [Mesorhizobium sp. ZC-5]|uniref:RES domain-containing protein n=1 Tax=Mesorhizobium sp. ZC-5 TaxID=2986066 RepID=UPI0021E7AD4B|nr:RES domain-containing protein [Mesorhizobium sp. ZC-5]MCV3243042.1 RES domain-containing protein [Mesorhizobium sp. ZC-5]